MQSGVEILDALQAEIAKDAITTSTVRYVGRSEWLVLWGVGRPEHAEARRRHVALGGKVLIWDMAYFGRGKYDCYVRFSINTDHPKPRMLDRAPDTGSRWEAHDIDLHDRHDPEGPVILVGMGLKSRRYLYHGFDTWERWAFSVLRERFPASRIIYRPKNDSLDRLDLPCAKDSITPIYQLLSGASLVFCRHSNVAVDAAVMGIPFECEDGAALWLKDRFFTRPNRLEFLWKLSWFQWHPSEAREAWAFIRSIA